MSRALTREGKKLKRFLSLFVICIIIVNVFGFDSQANESVDWEVIGIYPINVYDEEWKDMTFAEQLQALALPKELVDSLSTEDLAE